MKRAASLIRGLLFPPKCVCCRELMPYDTVLPLCKTCAGEWEKETLEPCGFCQRPVSECFCATPRMRRAGVSTLFKLAYYRAGKKSCPDRILFRMKESGARPLYSFAAKPLAKKILPYLLEKKIPLEDCILTFAPRHQRAFFRAGVDQAELLSKELSRELGIKQSALLERNPIKNKVQKRLNASERQKNAEAAFSIKEGLDLSGKTILLVDDTVTTGATMGVSAKLFKEAGAARVLGVAFTLDEIGRFPKEAPVSTRPYF
ncbi:MAG: ComF family protein [Clostridia bacterium]|nr:ComF family protein [Clostridia bacterium]